jgi:hypothetical protein
MPQRALTRRVFRDGRGEESLPSEEMVIFNVYTPFDTYAEDEMTPDLAKP